MSLKSGHQIHYIEKDEVKNLYENFDGNRFGVNRLLPQRWFVPNPFLEFADKYYDFKVKSTDVFVMSYPKSGSTWAQEIIWNMLHNPNLDNPKFNEPIFFRSPVFEGDIFAKAYPKSLLEPGSHLHKRFVGAYPDKNPAEGINFQLSESADDPRVLKTHMTFDLLPPSTLDTCKMVYTCRNPKDVLISFFKFARYTRNYGFKGNMEDWIGYFISDNVIFSPYWKHVKQAWDKRHHPNVLIIYYEDLRLNTRAEFKRIQEFLGINLTEKQLDNVMDLTSFESMKARQNVHEDWSTENAINFKVVQEEGGFFNKGKSGTWKEMLTEEQVKKMNEWIKKNISALDGDFKYKKDFIQ